MTTCFVLTGFFFFISAHSWLDVFRFNCGTCSCFSTDRRCTGYERQEIQHFCYPEKLQCPLCYITVFFSVVSLRFLHRIYTFLPKLESENLIYFSHPMCIHVLFECLCRVAITISYYALILNTSNLHGDPYLNCFLSALTEVPAYIIAMLLLQYCSRRFCQSSTLFLGGIMILCVHLIPIGKTQNHTAY